MTSPRGYAIHLTPEEVQAATEQGMARHKNARAAGFQNNYGFLPDDEAADIAGRGAELAVCKLLGVFPKVWDLQKEIAHRHEGDAAGYEVRSTKLEHGRLIIRPRDLDDRVYILVVGTAPKLRVVGWIEGKDAKQEIWWSAPNGRPGAYFVPQQALHDIGDLIECHLGRGEQ